MDSQNYSSSKQNNKNISAHWIAARSQLCNSFLRLFQQFVFEYLDFGWKPVYQVPSGSFEWIQKCPWG